MANAITPAYTPSRAVPVNAEWVDPRMADVEAVARWMDYAFVLPGGFRFGLAGIIGLLPGIGDVLDAVVSLYIVRRATQLGASRATLARMTLNVGIEAVAGAVPFVGDLFDVAFKANRRNYQLLRDHMAAPRKQTASDIGFLVLTLVLALIGIALPIWGLVWLFRHV